MDKNKLWHEMKERPTTDGESVIILYKNGCAWLWCYNLHNDAFYDCQEGYYRLNEDDAEKWAYLADLINATKRTTNDND